MTADRTIPASGGRPRRGQPGPAYLVDEDESGTRSRGRRRPSGSSCWLTASSPAASARARRSGSSLGRRSSGRSSTSRSHMSARSAWGSTRTARRRTSATSSPTPRPSACSARTRRSARRSSRAGGAARAARGPDLRRPPALEDEGRAYREAHPDALSTRPSPRSTRTTSSRSSTRRARPAPEGLHDPPSQLLRDGRRHRRAAATTSCRGCAAPLPPPRAQLRSARAPLGPYVGYTIAFLPDPLEVARALPQVRPDDPAERPSRLREGAHSRHVDVRRGDRRPAASRRLGARRRRAVERVCASRAGAVPRGLAAQAALADRLVFSKVKARLGGRLRTADLGRRAAGQGGRRVLRRDRHPDPRGVRPHGVHDARRRRTPRARTASARWAPRCPASSSASPTTASS